jgi:FtsZ-binding cell division protein ZapB
MADNLFSHADIETAENTDNPRNAGAKRKRGGSSTRGVANLTPDQLERKRANDREAQRAIRERTKNHIDRLNARIREYEQSNPYQELQAVVRQKEAIQAENEDMKKKMGQIVAMLQPFLGSMQGLEGNRDLLDCYTLQC